MSTTISVTGSYANANIILTSDSASIRSQEVPTPVPTPPLTEQPSVIPDNLDLAIFNKPEHIYYNSGKKMQASKLLEWMLTSEPQTWNTNHHYDGSTNQWPTELQEQPWWCGTNFTSSNATNLNMQIGYYYLDGSINKYKSVSAPTATYTDFEYDYVRTVKGQLQIASDGSVSLKDVSNILSVISSGQIPDGTFIYAEVFDISTSVPTAITCYVGLIKDGADVAGSCQCSYLKTISGPLIDFINRQISPDTISLKTQYP